MSAERNLRCVPALLNGVQMSCAHSATPKTRRAAWHASECRTGCGMRSGSFSETTGRCTVMPPRTSAWSAGKQGVLASVKSAVHGTACAACACHKGHCSAYRPIHCQSCEMNLTWSLALSLSAFLPAASGWCGILAAIAAPAMETASNAAIPTASQILPAKSAPPARIASTSAPPAAWTAPAARRERRALTCGWADLSPWVGMVLFIDACSVHSPPNSRAHLSARPSLQMQVRHRLCAAEERVRCCTPVAGG